MTAPTSVPRARPVSDVSAGVGIAGLLGLAAWVLFCRNFPEIAAAFGMPGQGRLSGPNSALLCVVVAGLPMVIWTLLVEKAHRRPSTGIDWDNVRPAGSTLDVSVTKLAGLWATWAIIGFVYCIQRFYWRGTWLFAMDTIAMLAVPMFLLSVPYVLWLDRRLVNPRDGAWHFGAMLIGREAYDIEEVWIHLRAWAVKGFFCAFMISILPFGFAAIVNADPAAIAGDPVRMVGLLIDTLFLVDVQIAMVGYLVTFKPLDAHIRSANPHLAGWVAALICYPPFIQMGGSGILDYHPGTADYAYWFQGQTALLWAWGAVMVFLTAIYAWATVAFGIRFSNLTYRGIVTNGPYAFTRHPAYLSKNLFWWLSTLPFLSTEQNPADIVRNTALLAGVSAVYYWRARTEEKHLLAEDAKYREYHAWMAENALITRGLAKLTRFFRPRGPQLQPAE